MKDGDSMNIVSCYVEFKKNILLDYINTICSNSDNPAFQTIVSNYIDTYIATYYFHRLETLDYEDDRAYDFNTVLQELDGKRIEMLYDNSFDSGRPIISKDIELGYFLTVVAIELDGIDEDSITEDKISKVLRTGLKSNSAFDSSVIKKIMTLMKQYIQKEEKFFEKLTMDAFHIQYKSFRYQMGSYFVSLRYDIEQLNCNYDPIFLTKNFWRDDLAYNRLETTLNLLNIDILYKLKAGEPLEYYFIPIPTVLLDENIMSKLEIISEESIKKHLIFEVDYSAYTNKKRILRTINKEYQLAALVDMTYIREIDQKIQTLDELPLFEYILLDHVKAKDYSVVSKYYDGTVKKIFLNEFVKE